MSSFCKACSIELFGEDLKELAGITTKEDWESGMAACVLCEECGSIQVDHEGNCISLDCLRAGKKGHGCPLHEGVRDV